MRRGRSLILLAGAFLLLQAGLKPGLHGGSFCGGVPVSLARPKHTASVGREARKRSEEEDREHLLNDEIRALEVRVVGVVAEAGEDVETDAAGIKDVNQVMTRMDALQLARDRGHDLILFNEDMDPPLVKIASYGKFKYGERVRLKEAAKNAKIPKVKEVKLSYSMAHNDMMTMVNRMETWMKRPRQQVKVKCVLKGRQKMFERQAVELMERFQQECAMFAKVSNPEKGLNAQKDNRGDLTVLFNPGPDNIILKKMIQEAGGKKALMAMAEEDDEDEDESDEEEEEEVEEKDEEVARLEQELKDVIQELEEMGIPRGRMGQEEEYKEIVSELDKAKANAAKAKG